MYIFKKEKNNNPMTPKELKDIIQKEIDTRLSFLLTSKDNVEVNQGVLQTLYDLQKLLERVW